ncbi:hypothetical protein QEN19_002656 [Hanseniaspora menglaensis]
MKMFPLEIGTTCDMHVHLRDGEMCDLVTPTVKEGGINVAYIMPNLQPPITTVEQVKIYKAKLEKLAPSTKFLMSFYLNDTITPALIDEAKDYIHGIKVYPAGVTTNSSGGVDPTDFTPFYPVFEKMQQYGLVLNIHGETPFKKGSNTTVMTAEPEFLPVLEVVHAKFPTLKIVLEHCTTEAAIKLVKKIDSPYVSATITIHHLSLTIDDVVGSPLNFCKPVAKTPYDQKALKEAVLSGDSRFFLGTDSAPHVACNKNKLLGCAAGVYVSKYTLQILAQFWKENNGDWSNFIKFVSTNGLTFYGLKANELPKEKCYLIEKQIKIEEKISSGDITVIPFKAGETLDFDIEWK